MLTHGSLFAGIGGFDLGFERAGIKTVWQVEIEGYCRKVLAKHFPNAQRFSDIRECGKHNLPWVDILSGGFPCQDISNAGKRAGIEGERSGLWSEYARIIGELRPRYVVVENVAALLGRGMGRILGDLAACGYDAEWQSIRASDVGAPHRRERIWLVAYPRRQREHGIQPQRPQGGNQAKSWNDGKSGSMAYSAANNVARRRHTGSNPRYSECLSEIPERCEMVLANTVRNRSTQRVAGSGRRSDRNAGILVDDRDAEGWPQNIGAVDWWTTEPDVGRVAHGIPARVDRLRGLGNAIVPQIAEWIGRRILETAGKGAEAL